MSILRNIVWAMLVLQLIISTGKNEELAEAPKSCLDVDQSRPGQVAVPSANFWDILKPVLGSALKGVTGDSGAMMDSVMTAFVSVFEHFKAASGPLMITPVKRNSKEHGRTDFKCEAPKSLKPRFRWFRNGKATELPTTQYDFDLTIESVLTFQPTREDNGTEIYCSVWSESEKKEFKSCFVTLDVEYAPKITMSTYPDILEIGAPGRVDCFVDANPAPLYVKLMGDEASVKNFTYDKESKKYRISVYVPSFSQRDSGRYTCTAENSHGSAKQDLYVETLQMKSSTSITIAYAFAGIISFIVVALVIVVLVRLYQRKQLPFLSDGTMAKLKRATCQTNNSRNQSTETPHTRS